MSDPHLSIQPFRGFGGDRRVCVSGQVTFGRKTHVRRPRVHDARRRLWRRLGDALSLAVSRRVPRARVRVLCGGVQREVVSDSHGYFSACLELPPQEPGPLWREYLVELVEPALGEAVAARGEILMATPASRRVVVSDIDDTVIFTGVSNKLLMLWRLFAHGVRERMPFPGIAALYRGLHGGRDGGEENPMIYISRSPWSIYPTLEEFFQHHRIPIGPVLLLRDWGISLRHPFPRRARGHKQALLERVLDVYPDLPLVLIGDSGQRDPELYAALAREHPDRVEAVYIRDLGLSRRRSAELSALQDELAGLGVPMIPAGTTERLAHDAEDRGWISGRDLAEVHGERVREEA
jgi:phosphatidate phosphatase APP1